MNRFNNNFENYKYGINKNKYYLKMMYEGLTEKKQNNNNKNNNDKNNNDNNEKENIELNFKNTEQINNYIIQPDEIDITNEIHEFYPPKEKEEIFTGFSVQAQPKMKLLADYFISKEKLKNKFKLKK